MTRPTTRKRPGRVRQVARVLTPRRVKRMQARWRRRRRKARAVTQAVKRAPSRVAAGARKVRQAPGNAKRKVAGAAAATKQRLTRRRDPVAQCCGKDIPRSEMAAHLANHETAAKRADTRRANTRAKNFRGGQQPTTTPRATRSKPKPRTRKPKPPPRPDQPTRAQAAAPAAGWIVLGSGALLMPLAFPPSGWFTVVGGTFIAAGGVTYVAQRRWGVGSGSSDREAKKALKAYAKQRGCSSACMVSTKPKNTCRCPCGGETHGMSAHGNTGGRAA